MTIGDNRKLGAVNLMFIMNLLIKTANRNEIYQQVYKYDYFLEWL